MKRIALIPFIILALLGACQTFSPAATPTLFPSQTPSPSPTPSPLPTLTATPSSGFAVEYHPDGGLFPGDQVSLVVVPVNGQDTSGSELQVSYAGAEIGRGQFGPYGVGQRNQSTLFWVWDTSGLTDGPHTLDFTLLPNGPSWQETFTLRPESEKPLNERDARWATTTTDCCILNYITNTEAERDLDVLVERANTEAEIVEELMRTDFTEKVSITFLPRTLGHGGFASDGIFVSYLDANYAGGQPELVFRHEMVHILDARLGGKSRPSILVEGLATYMTGGHFKTEPIAPRAAALLDLGWYIPLRELSDNFYPSQHEIGYLQAAALIQYLVETYGWEQFNAFYRNIDYAASDSAAIDAALQRDFGYGFDALESNFIAFLRSQPQNPAYARDVELTVHYYDSVRRYQRLLDPSAYFMTAWLPDANALRTRGIVADYMRRPQGTVNTGLESMFVQADVALRAGDFDATASLLKSINVMLDIVEAEHTAQ